jgi:hypothetical protein
MRVLLGLFAVALAGVNQVPAVTVVVAPARGDDGQRASLGLVVLPVHVAVAPAPL